MRIYKSHQISRMAAEMLCKDLMENKDYTFTNTSYGGRGEVLGTIAKKDYNDNSEGTIQYRLETNWHTEETKLIREVENVFYKTNDREYKKDNIESTIMTLYKISRDGVYTDDSEYAKQAHEKTSSRYSRDRNYKRDGLSGNHPIKSGSALYDKLFTEISKFKTIKYGTDITVNVYKYDTERYDWDENMNAVKTPITEVSVSVRYTYRGREYHYNKSKFTYVRKTDLQND